MTEEAGTVAFKAHSNLVAHRSVHIRRRDASPVGSPPRPVRRRRRYVGRVVVLLGRRRVGRAVARFARAGLNLGIGESKRCEDTHENDGQSFSSGRCKGTDHSQALLYFSFAAGDLEKALVTISRSGTTLEEAKQGSSVSMGTLSSASGDCCGVAGNFAVETPAGKGEPHQRIKPMDDLQ